MAFVQHLTTEIAGGDLRPKRGVVYIMSSGPTSNRSLDDADIEFDEETLRRIRERVLSAEKEKLNLDTPHGINNEIEETIREEVE